MAKRENQGDCTAVTVCIAGDLYAQAFNLARESGVSLNEFVVRRLADVVKLEEERLRFDEYTALGGDEECDVEYAVYAQAEVMLGD